MNIDEARKIIWPTIRVERGEYHDDEHNLVKLNVDLDALANIWKSRLEPKGWWWEKYRERHSQSLTWWASNEHAHLHVQNTGDFLRDFTLLTALVIQKDTP